MVIRVRIAVVPEPRRPVGGGGASQSREVAKMRIDVRLRRREASRFAANVCVAGAFFRQSSARSDSARSRPFWAARDWDRDRRNVFVGR